MAGQENTSATTSGLQNPLPPASAGYFDYLTLPDVREMNQWMSEGDVGPADTTDLAIATTPIGTPTEQLQAAGNVTISVSTTFFPRATVDPHPSDLILVSSDNVFFHVHVHRLQGASQNSFAGLASADRRWNPGEGVAAPVETMSELADVANVILHIVYGISCAQYGPTLLVVRTAMMALQKYGVSAMHNNTTNPTVYELLVSHAPLHPIETYAQAAKYGLEDAAVAISPRLLSYDLPSLTDELAAEIGTLYLKRLFFLHYDRMDQLKRVLLHPPEPHSPVPFCGPDGHRILTRLWALASAHIGWDARPNLSTASLQMAFAPIENEVSCEFCKHALRARVDRLLTEWAAVKRTI